MAGVMSGSGHYDGKSNFAALPARLQTFKVDARLRGKSQRCHAKER